MATTASAGLDLPNITSPVIYWKSVVVILSFFKRRGTKKDYPRAGLKRPETIGVSGWNVEQLRLSGGENKAVLFCFWIRFNDIVKMNCTENCSTGYYEDDLLFP